MVPNAKSGRLIEKINATITNGINYYNSELRNAQWKMTSSQISPVISRQLKTLKIKSQKSAI